MNFLLKPLYRKTKHEAKTLGKMKKNLKKS